MTSTPPRPRIFVQTDGPPPEYRPHAHPGGLRASLLSRSSSLSFTPLSPAEEVKLGLEMTLGSSPARDTNG